MEIAHLQSKYRDRMLTIAHVVSGWSTEPEGQRHGSVLSLEGKYIIATGFNGPDRTWASDPNCGGTCCERAPLVHAEVNAIINAIMVGADIERCVAYVTKQPCGPCQAALEGAGVRAVFWLQDAAGRGHVWTR